jgi:hypothetical protein
MGPFIRVAIQPGRFPGQHDADIVLPLPEELVFEAYRPIDLPSIGAGIAAAFCTPAPARVKVMADRERAASVISGAVTKILLEHMAAQDTLMGHPKR